MLPTPFKKYNKMIIQKSITRINCKNPNIEFKLPEEVKTLLIRFIITVPPPISSPNIFFPNKGNTKADKSKRKKQLMLKNFSVASFLFFSYIYNSFLVFIVFVRDR